ncbi:MAG: GTP-binding protein [Bacillota bacterium]|nr:GTP-binding protein [Bacillota bacterium]
MKKTEVYILSGFLGSGKTTLLKRLLEDEKSLGRKVAVMMNELGKVSIDSDAIEEDVSLKELLGGCICCTLQDKLEAQLQGLLVLEKPEVIYIETTGAAHPVEVLDAILSPLFAHQLIVKGIITTVDGLRWLDRKNLNPQLHQLVLEQVRHADFVIINKTDELTESQQAAISYEIQALNANAPCLLTTHSQISLQSVRKLQLSHEREDVKTISKKDLHLSTFVYQFQNEIKQEEFISFLQCLPETIYRIKGYVKLDSGYPYLFQFSYGMPQFLKEYMNMPLNVVFIGENVDWKAIKEQLSVLERS